MFRGCENSPIPPSPKKPNICHSPPYSSSLPSFNTDMNYHGQQESFASVDSRFSESETPTLNNLLSEPLIRSKLTTVSTMEDCVELIKSCSNIIILTGADVSVSCGTPDLISKDRVCARLAQEIPDFPDPQTMFDMHHNFRKDPRPIFKFAQEIHPGQFKPTPCHKFIRAVERADKLLRNYCQNIDILEQVVGIEKVFYHGSSAKTTASVSSSDWQTVPASIDSSQPDTSTPGGDPNNFSNLINKDKKICDLLIVIGSSFTDRPVSLIPSSLPTEVPQILINREPLPPDNFDVELLGDCDSIISQICLMLGEGCDNSVHMDRLEQYVALPAAKEETCPCTPKVEKQGKEDEPESDVNCNDEEDSDGQFLLIPPARYVVIGAEEVYTVSSVKAVETDEFNDAVNVNSEFQDTILQVDGETMVTDLDLEETAGLILYKQVLDKLLRDQYDQFEILSLGNKLQVDIQSETNFSQQKYILQKHILECILREDGSNHYLRLLEETMGLCNFKKVPGYSCCLTGCSFRSDRHRGYVKHLQKVHSNFHKLACKFKHTCTREFSSILLLVEHIGHCHSTDTSNAYLHHLLSIDIACKCSIMTCGGKQFANMKLLMTHVNVEHVKEPRECIFDDCSKHFDANSVSRNHFRTVHINKNRTKLKRKYIVNEGLQGVGTGTEYQEEEGASVDVDLDIYEDEDKRFLEVDDTEIDDPDLRSDYFLRAYADFCNRMCHVKYVPHQTMQTIASEYLSQSVMSLELREKKLRESLRSLPNVTEDQIEKIVTETVVDDAMVKAQKQLDTDYKRSKYIQENFKYVSPQEIILNKDEIERGMPKECFHYISVVDSFKTLMEDETFIEVIEKERQVSERKAEVIMDVKDGSAYQDIEYFKQNPGALTSIFYSDALELVNPLGAARGKHKVVNIFWTLGDIPKSQRSQIDRMMLALVVKEKHLKKYGFSVIYKVLIDDLKRLEDGILIEKPVPRLVKCGVLLHAGDNLESHSVGGFSMCFSSMDVCRFCHIQYSDLKEHIHDMDGDVGHEYWTTKSYDEICDSIESNREDDEEAAARPITHGDLDDHLFDEFDEPNNEEGEENDVGNPSDESAEENDEAEEENDESEEENIEVGNRFGLRERCPFNALQSFHAVYGFPPDLLHDLYEGVVAQDLCGFIKILSSKGLFTIKEYNEALHNHRYKSYEMNDRPQPIIKPKAMKLTGKAVSVWLHIRSFGMIIKNFEIGLEDEVLCLCLDLAKITERLSASEFREHEIEICEDRILKYLDSRKKVFSEYPNLLGSPKPKHHFLVHYPDAIRMFGPPLSYWTGRFESKHRVSKGTAEAAKNFKNITATLSVRQQMRMASKYYTGMFDTASVHLLDSVTNRDNIQEGAEFMSPGDVICSKIVLNTTARNTRMVT